MRYSCKYNTVKSNFNYFSNKRKPADFNSLSQFLFIDLTEKSCREK